MDNIDNIDLDQDIDKLYELMNDASLNKKHEDIKKLNKLRNENHKKYYEINLVQLNNLPDEYKELVNDIKNLYLKIVPKNILSESETEAQQTKTILTKISNKINRVEKMITTNLKELEKSNDEKQSEFSITNFKNLDIDEKNKKKVLNMYNELILYNATVEKDIYHKFKRELVRKKYIDEILKLISIGTDELLNEEKKYVTDEMNAELSNAIDKANDKIQYLSDLMMEDSEYEDSFNDFVDFYNKITSYDNTNYENVKQTLEILKDEDKFDVYANEFENNFIDEREKNQNEEKFIYQKIGIKNIRMSLDYISSNYMDLLDKPRKLVIEDSYQRLDEKEVDIEILDKNLNNIVKYIWENTITNIDKKDNFYYLCTNSLFKEPKMESILLSKNILNRMDNFLDYQIGFICKYNSNILYITENSDIMSVKHDDLSRLKTPKQIEQEYINFNTINKIALDGFMTTFVGVYFIDDGDKIKLKKAQELSKENKLPLIILKKN